MNETRGNARTKPMRENLKEREINSLKDAEKTNEFITKVKNYTKMKKCINCKHCKNYFKIYSPTLYIDTKITYCDLYYSTIHKTLLNRFIKCDHFINK